MQHIKYIISNRALLKLGGDKKVDTSKKVLVLTRKVKRMEPSGCGLLEISPTNGEYDLTKTLQNVWCMMNSVLRKLDLFNQSNT